MHVFGVLLALLCAASWARAAAKCAPEFAEMCECGYVPIAPEKQPRYVTNCTNAGFENANMLMKLPPETEMLIFVGNEVKDLPYNIFGLEVTHDKLHTIDFSNNHIQTIKGRTFHNVANVTKLILNDNDLYIVSKDHHPRMFSNFVHLKELHLRNAFTEKIKADNYVNNLGQIFGNSSLIHLQVLNLEHNEITDFDYNVFCSFPALEKLYLGNNLLKDLNFNFYCLKYLKELDASFNMIPYLSEQTLRNFDSIRPLKLNLTGNRFKCDCNLLPMYEWLIDTSFKLVNRAHFYCWDGPPGVIGKTLSAVHPDELQCPYRSSASFVLLSLGIVCLLTVVCFLLYKNRASVGLFVRRTLRHFHYVSLDRRDDSMEV